MRSERSLAHALRDAGWGSLLACSAGRGRTSRAVGTGPARVRAYPPRIQRAAGFRRCLARCGAVVCSFQPPVFGRHAEQRPLCVALFSALCVCACVRVWLDGARTVLDVGGNGVERFSLQRQPFVERPRAASDGSLMLALSPVVRCRPSDGPSANRLHTPGAPLRVCHPWVGTSPCQLSQQHTVPRRAQMHRIAMCCVGGQRRAAGEGPAWSGGEAIALRFACQHICQSPARCSFARARQLPVI